VLDPDAVAERVDNAPVLRVETGLPPWVMVDQLDLPLLDATDELELHQLPGGES
jgi:hypothetical protein